jgi:signal transduction histidine kinase
MAIDPRFSELVSLACHDLRTPLATVAGFAATLLRHGELDEKSTRYVTLIETAAGQLGLITDDLSTAARVAGERYEPSRETRDSLELAQAAAAALGDGRVVASGSGQDVSVDPEAVTRALAALATAAIRHGRLEQITLEVDSTRVSIRPVAPEAAAVVVGAELRDLGAAVGCLVIEALGGAVAQAEGAVVVSLPAA